MTRIVDPMPFLGIDSGMRVLRASTTEAATLRRAIAILERAHDQLTDYDPDHQDYPDVDLCTAPDTLRALIDGITLL